MLQPIPDNSSSDTPDVSVCLVTKTYGPDLERCELLCQSVDRFVHATKHLIVVDAGDLPAFAHLERPRRHVVATEDVLPAHLRRFTFGPVARRRNVWLSTATRPVRGWLVQQLVKLAAARVSTEDVLAHVDSDIVFVRPFDALTYVREEVPLFHVAGAIDSRLPTHVRWHRTAERLLGVDPAPLPAPDFVGPLIFWRRDNASALLEHIERRVGGNWLAALARASDVSEYTLYGRFAVDVLGRESRHRLTNRSLCYSYWDTEPLDDGGLERFLEGIENEVCVMLNPKAGMNAGWYGPLLERSLPGRAP